MLNKSIDEVVNVIPLPDDFEYQIINTTDGILKKYVYHITGITEKEYNMIKKGETLNITRDKVDFRIIPDNILCFGKIDFNKGSEDCATLDTFKWLSNLILTGKHIPSNYNYETHSCTSPNSKMLWTETFKVSVLCRYLHGCIGKPELTLIFKEII